MKPKIVILHGWGKRIDRWQKVKRELEKAGWSVFLPFLPGFGSQPAPARPWGLKEYEQWVKERLPARYFLIGHSFGGRIAIRLASQNPKGLVGLILINSAGIKPKFSFKKFIFIILAKIGKIVFLLPPLFFFRGLAKKFLYFLAGERDYYQAKGVMKETLKKVVREDLKENLKKIKVPTLILWGEKDRVTPVADGQLMARLIKKAEIKIAPLAGHLLPFEFAKETATEILAFCQKYQ